MKIFKSFLVTTITALLFIAYGCQQESVLDTAENLPYLSLPENTDFNNLSEEEFSIVLQAFGRLSIYEDEDGLSVLNTKSGFLVSISENIYQYCKEIIRNSNERLISLSGVVVSRSTLTNEERPGAGVTDCLSYALGAASGYGYDVVDEWIVSMYGYDGVDFSDVHTAISHYGYVAQIDPYQIPQNVQLTDSYIVILDYSHAVNACGIIGNKIMFHDYQRSYSQIYETELSHISAMYNLYYVY